MKHFCKSFVYDEVEKHFDELLFIISRIDDRDAFLIK
jgi:hypothetical protein